MSHDEFNCECHETCSWCTESVPVTELSDKGVPDGAMICRDCRLGSRKDGWA